MATVVFKFRIDWWIWAVLAFSLAVVSVCFIGLPWWLTLIYGAGIVASFAQNLHTVCRTFRSPQPSSA